MASPRRLSKVRWPVHYCGKDDQKAIERWNDWDALPASTTADLPTYHAEHSPPPSCATTVEGLVNRYLDRQADRLEAGRLRSSKSLYLMRRSCKFLAESVGRKTAVSDLTPSHFANLANDLRRKLSAVSAKNEIIRIRSLFKWGPDELLCRAVAYGRDFSVEATAIDSQRATRGVYMFEPDEIDLLLKAASPAFKAAILLGINCGFGGQDCGQLRWDFVDLEKRLHFFPRPKTGAARMGILWPETIDAINAWVKVRPEGKSTETESLVFLTPRSPPGRTGDFVARHFRKLADKALGKKCRGRGFYAFRHTFETVAGESADQVAVDHIMGHKPSSMSANYRQKPPSRKRLEAVANKVHAWWKGDEKK